VEYLINLEYAILGRFLYFEIAQFKLYV